MCFSSFFDGVGGGFEGEKGILCGCSLFLVIVSDSLKPEFEGESGFKPFEFRLQTYGSFASAVSRSANSKDVHFTEEFGTMEVGCGRANGVPTDEVRNGQVVATLIDISSEHAAIQGSDVVAEEDGVGDA